MYKKAYGIIETLAPLHVGAAAGEESGNLNLIFRDQFTQTGIIPGSSIRGRFRADMRRKRLGWLEADLNQQELEVSYDEIPEKLNYLQWLELTWLDNELKKQGIPTNTEQKSLKDLRQLKQEAKKEQIKFPDSINENYWYGNEAEPGQDDGGTTEAIIKFEYASLVWLPVYCPNQPVVFVSCPTLLNRYQRITGKEQYKFQPYSYSGDLPSKKLFFNLGFLTLGDPDKKLKDYFPTAIPKQYPLVIVDDNDMAMIHDMALYRQSRVALEDNQKKAKNGAFFNVEALPEGSILVFPLAMREKYNGKDIKWEDYLNNTNLNNSPELYFGGLESIGFGRTNITVQEVKGVNHD